LGYLYRFDWFKARIVLEEEKEMIRLFFSQHPYWAMFGLFWLLNNIVTTMPSPKAGGWTNNLLYAWLFSMLHATVGGFPRLFTTVMPDSAIAKLWAGLGPSSTDNTKPPSDSPPPAAPFTTPPGGTK
jgi:hypothetical protein